MRELILCAALVWVGSGPGTAQERPRPVVVYSGISEYRLPNGLRVLLYPDANAPTVTVNATYLVGSRLDGYGETGEAHLLEHLMFKGSNGHPDLYREFSSHGIAPTGRSGNTTADRTSFLETLPASDEELEWALRMEADRMVNSLLRKQDLDSEMTVVRNEWDASEGNSLQVLLKRTRAVAYDWHSYGRDVLGTRSDFENVSIDRLRIYYRTYYQPDNAVLLVAGKFGPEKTLALITSTFGAIPRPSRQLPVLPTVEPPQDGGRLVVVRRPGGTAISIAAYHVPGATHPDTAAIEVLARVLGAPGSGRLGEHIGSHEATATDGVVQVQRDASLLTLVVHGAKGGTPETLRAQFEQSIQLALATPPTPEQVERAKTALLSSIDVGLESPERITSALSDCIGMGDWRLLWVRRERLKAVTAEDVQRVAATYLKPTNRTIGLYVPTEEPNLVRVPPAPDAAEAVQNLKEPTADAAWGMFDRSPGNIEAHLYRAVLPAGLKIAVLEKPSPGDVVVAVLNLRFGDAGSTRNRATVGLIASQMLPLGTKRHSAQQIQDDLTRWKSSVVVLGAANTLTVSLQCPAQAMPDVLARIAEMLREPSFPDRALEAVKSRFRAALEERRHAPESLVQFMLQRHIEPYEPDDARRTPALEEAVAQIDAVTIVDLLALQTGLYGASHGELAVVGPVDPKAVERTATDLFGDWRSLGAYARLESPQIGPPPSRETMETPGKPNAALGAGMYLAMRDDDADYPALLLANELLGSGFLNSRLAVRLRQKEGLSYSVQSLLKVPCMDTDGRFFIFATFAPQNAARVEAAVIEELERILKDGFTAQEVEAAKAGLRQARMVSRTQDSQLARLIAINTECGRSFAWEASLDDRIAGLKPEQVLAAVRRHLAPEKLTIVKAGDFASQGAK